MNASRIIWPEEVKQRMDAGEPLFIIDVREDEEVAAGMIPGAKHMAMSTFPERVGELSADAEIIVVCRSGNRSGRVCEYLEMLGYARARNMVGGMIAWAQLDS